MKNAVLDDLKLQADLKHINPKFGDFVIRVAGEVWGLPLIDQKTKALIAIAVDIINQTHTGSGNSFTAHVNMALKQGATYEEIAELLLFMCVYAGFNKVAVYFNALKEIFQQSGDGNMISALRKEDYSIRDRQGQLTFYALLWKRKGISLELFDDYWRNVHGPLCARLPGQHQYWQFHLEHSEGGLWPTIDGIDYDCPAEDQFDGIAELTFETETQRQKWFQSAAILMDDEHNLFSKAIGYNTNGNSQTYVDGIPTPDPNGNLGLLKFHVMVKKSDDVSVDNFRQYLTQSFAPAVVKSDSVLKFRLHLFEEVDNSRPDAAGVSHFEPLQKQYQAAFEIAFANPLEMETFFASREYAVAVQDQAKYIKQLLPFPERSVYTFVYDGKMTLAGQRSSTVAELIVKVGATNELKEDIVSLMNGKQNGKTGLGHYLQGVQHFGMTVYDMAKAMEFYTEVLGGKVALSGDGFIGPVLHNTLFQKEDIEAIERGIDPKTLGVPNLRDGSDAAIDVRFVSFGNTVVELIHFRDAKLTPNAPNIFDKVSSCVGYANVPHLSFYVKDDVDLNLFAKTLEQECQRRGLTDVVFNRIIDVKSEAERNNLALKYNANKFWNEPEYFVEGYSDSEFGDFEGWSLFYCKGPNGEQLEFNQVTRKAKENFTRAEAEYNQANNTNYWFLNSQTKTTNTNGNETYGKYNISQLQPITDQSLEPEKAQQLLQTAQPETIKKGSFDLKQLIENQTTKEDKSMTQTTVISLSKPEIVRQMFQAGESMNVNNFVEFYTDDCLYQFSNFPIAYGHQGIKDNSVAFLDTVAKVYHHIKNMWEIGNTVICEMDVTYIRHDGKVFTLPCCDTIIFKGDKVQELRIYMNIDPVFQTEQVEPQTVAARGSLSQKIEKMYEALQAENWDEFISFFTPDVLYKIGANDPVIGPQNCRDLLTHIYKTLKLATRNIRGIWEIGNTVVLEMDANYIHKQDKRFVQVPCVDIYRFEGDKIYEWRVYADASASGVQL
ncbi:nuclear transport factor 2 family protein [Nostoc sp. FACHB-152]|uniref:nuclear transport factor 2 family protein n=1 Tax=unclassified Nostoc TaxID=2593658 RepID=UPI001686AE1B|nr:MULTISPECIES: nuclear transport factor 2 family protein [unclassified Nostoc]MBD2449510.1 nuclear transport factor 2 family protein [Nostoc sp. FACHB-152]MBD2470273.1 nuclear transport factor 2 family protein [Nostoc sp. FACHB-145]